MKRPPIFVILDDSPSYSPPRRSRPAPSYDKLPPIMRIAHDQDYDIWLHRHAPKLHLKLWLIRFGCSLLFWLLMDLFLALCK